MKHLKEYAPEDHVVLSDFLEPFGSITITPHVATETSHFIQKIGDLQGKRVKARFVELLQVVGERNVESRTAAARSEFAWLDLADCTLLDGGTANETLLSTDAKLVCRRWELGLPAVNFNHLREQAGLL